MRILSYDPATPGVKNPGCPDGRDYRGRAFLCVPVMYAAPGGPPRAIGVINLTDRVGEDAFTAGDRKLVAAIANQIGAAIENSRLAAHEQGRQRVQRELELAHDLQLKLLPAPSVLTGLADVAVRCRPAESVGGDFYNLLRLHGDRVGVMIGDVSSHGFGAALIMALAMAAAGIHAEVAEAPADVLARLEESLADELRETEMYFTLFYGVLRERRPRLRVPRGGRHRHRHAARYHAHPAGVRRRKCAWRGPDNPVARGSGCPVPVHRRARRGGGSAGRALRRQPRGRPRGRAARAPYGRDPHGHLHRPRRLHRRGGRLRRPHRRTPQGVSPRRLGQHFLNDRNILRRIVDALEPARTDVVIEVGAGRGSLTRALAPRVLQVIAIEKDKP